MEIPPALENLIRSDDGIDWPREVAPGVIVSITVREIRRNRTGLHGFIAVTNGHQIFGHDTFNLLRLEERHRLARRSSEHFGTLLSGAYPKEHLAHDLDTLCMWLALEYESSQFEMEEVDPDTVVPPAQFLLDPYIVGNSGTILFGEPGAGKSYICQAMAVCLSRGINELWGITTPTPTVYINLERPERSMVIREQRLRSVLDIHGRTGVKYIHARGHGLPAVAPTVRKWSKANPHGLVILDSITRAGLGNLVENDTGNTFINTMNSLGCAWLGIGHSPRDSQDHIFGSVMYDAGEDIGVQVRSELKGLTRGLALKMTKSNDTAFPPINYYALDFAEDNSGLTGIRIARKSEFPEMASSGPISRRQQIVNFLNDQPDGAASVKEIADGVEMSPSNVSPLMKDDPTFQALPKEGRVRRYRVAAQTDSYDS